MRIISQNKKLFLSLAVLVVVLSLYSLVSFIFSPPKILSVTPQDKSTEVSLAPQIIITFNKAPNKNLLRASLSPDVSIVVEFKGNTLEITPKDKLKYNKAYSVILINRVNLSRFFVSSFTTGYPEGGASIPQEAEKITQDFYPLLPYSPLDTAGFYFIYTDRLKLTVGLKGKKEEAKKEFLDFAKEKGVDLSKHEIIYISPP